MLEVYFTLFPEVEPKPPAVFNCAGGQRLNKTSWTLLTLRTKVWRILRTAPAYLCHPKGMTCLNCGFLELGDREVGTAYRVALADNGEPECPPLDKLHCAKKLWVRSDLRIFDDGRGGLFRELQERRRPCVGFLRYRPGRSPSGHLNLEDKKRARRERRVDVLISAFVGAVVALLTTQLTTWLLKHHGLR
jgi:hypothetical protein